VGVLIRGKDIGRGKYTKSSKKRCQEKKKDSLMGKDQPGRKGERLWNNLIGEEGGALHVKKVHAKPLSRINGAQR